VNSATHIWGSRRFATRDDSTNNWLVAVLTFGEGWHNNHHAHPTSARHGLRWYEVDVNWYGIWMLMVLGLAKQIQFTRLAPLFPGRNSSASEAELTLTSARRSQGAAGD
jgi:fatty-acid desaturase